MKTVLFSLVSVGVLALINPLHANASPIVAAVPKEMPYYFFTTPQQLDELLIQSIETTHPDLSIQDLRIHARQYELAGECDHVFFTFRSNAKLFLGIGELKESRVQAGKLVARTLVQVIKPHKPFEIEYAFSGCLPSLAGKVNDPSITRVDMVENNGRTTPIYVHDGFLFKVLDLGINVREFQQVRFIAKDRNNSIVASISGSELYPTR